MGVKINELVIRATIEKEQSSKEVKEKATEMVVTPEKTIELQSLNKINRER